MVFNHVFKYQETCTRIWDSLDLSVCYSTCFAAGPQFTITNGHVATQAENDTVSVLR